MSFDPSDPEANKLAVSHQTRILLTIYLTVGRFLALPLTAGRCPPTTWEVGSAGMNQTRTSWDHSLILAIPFSRWGALPYIVDPIPFPSGILSSVFSESLDHRDERPNRMHPYRQASLWRQEIMHDSGITKARIAATEGLSRARVTQLMNLLELPEEIQKDLQTPPAPLEIYSFSERRLRQLLTCDDRESQLSRWQELVRECQILVRKLTKISQQRLVSCRN